jgi:hypothetical protein
MIIIKSARRATFQLVITVRRLALMSVLLGLFFVSAPVWAYSYSTDFSSDPGWTTNNAGNFYWDAGAYHVVSIKGADEYSYVALPFDVAGNSFRLSYDIKMLRSDWASFVSFGINDPGMESIYAWGQLDPNSIQVVYMNVDAGMTASTQYVNKDGGHYHPGQDQPLPFATDVWYHNELVFDDPADTLTLTVTQRDTGELVGTQAQVLAGVGEFNDLVRLGVTNYGDHYASGAEADALIDDVNFEVVPEPATVTLLGLALTGLVAKVARRRNR